ncbi:hypothetical protein [Kitasatospora sp. NBC_01266]|uniref:hypothetical protein n=1 Tax=Kitasatospora sp. NBC_01266 TaxID=2903572 RepID=UPI002E2F44B4|nr:hypothetical protein [Kitasatospora sp. NBC_01266]
MRHLWKAAALGLAAAALGGVLYALPAAAEQAPAPDRAERGHAALLHPGSELVHALLRHRHHPRQDGRHGRHG